MSPESILLLLRRNFMYKILYFSGILDKQIKNEIVEYNKKVLWTVTLLLWSLSLEKIREVKTQIRSEK